MADITSALQAAAGAAGGGGVPDYVAIGTRNSSSEAINIFSISDGTLTYVSTYVGASRINGFQFDINNEYAYSARESGSNTIYQGYSFDTGAGTLSSVSTYTANGGDPIINQLAISSTYLAAFNSNNTAMAQLFTYSSGTLTRTSTYTTTGLVPVCGDITKDGTNIALSDFAAIRRLNTTGGTLSFGTTYTCSSTPYALDISHSGTYVAVSTTDSGARSQCFHINGGSFSFVSSYASAGACTSQTGVRWTPDDDYVTFNTADTNIDVLAHNGSGGLTRASTYVKASGEAGATTFVPVGNVNYDSISPPYTFIQCSFVTATGGNYLAWVYSLSGAGTLTLQSSYVVGTSGGGVTTIPFVTATNLIV